MWDLLGAVVDVVLGVLYWRVYLCMLAGFMLGMALLAGTGDRGLGLPITFMVGGFIVGVIWHSASDDDSA